MIIIEGPDGGGKSHLLKQLHDDLGIPIHERAVLDKFGPRDTEGATLWSWAHHDVHSWPAQGVHLYDRHPLISEYIYGPVTRGKVAPGFNHPSAHNLRKIMEMRCLLVLCLPKWEIVQHNMGLEEQMRGVIDNGQQIYALYEALSSSWSGWRVVYDFVPWTHGDESQYEAVKMACRMQAAQWKTNAGV